MVQAKSSNRGYTTGVKLGAWLSLWGNAAFFVGCLFILHNPFMLGWAVFQLLCSFIYISTLMFRGYM